MKRIKAVKRLPSLHKKTGTVYKEALPRGLQKSFIKPSKAEAIMAKALEDRNIDYTATPSQDGQRINFSLPDQAAVIRIQSQPVTAYSGVDAEELLYIANQTRVIDATEADVVSNVAQVINQIGSLYG